MKASSSSGIGVPGVLVTLKLCHLIDWSWWWVLSPLWLGTLFALVVVGIALAWLKLGEAADRRRRWKQSQ